MKGLKRWLGVLGALTGSIGFILMGLEKLIILAGIMIVVGLITFAFMTKIQQKRLSSRKNLHN